MNMPLAAPLHEAGTQAFRNVSELLGITDIRMYRAVEHTIRNELALRPIESLNAEVFRLLAKTALDLVLARARARYVAVSAGNGRQLFLLTTGLFGDLDEGNAVARFNTPMEAIKFGRLALNRPTNSYVISQNHDYLSDF